MKNIAIFVKNLTSGGAEKQSVLLSKALAGEYKIHYIIFNAQKVHKKYLDLLCEDKRIIITSFSGNFISRCIQLKNYLRRYKIEAIFSYLTMANLLSIVLGKVAGVKQIYTGLRNAQLPWIKLQVDKLLCNYGATVAICNCYSGKDNFVKEGYKIDKIIVIPNCYENISPYEIKNSDNVIRIITVGRFVKQKDYKTVIQSISELRHLISNRKILFKFQIVGYGEMEQQVKTWVKEFKIDDITDILVNPDNILQIERQADIYLSTSLFEGTSNSIMEGMDANLPIVCTNVGDNSYLVENCINGYLCNVGDYKNIARRLKELIDNQNKRLSLGKKSKEILLKHYNTELFRQRYIAVIERYS